MKKFRAGASGRLGSDNIPHGPLPATTESGVLIDGLVVSRDDCHDDRHSTANDGAENTLLSQHGSCFLLDSLLRRIYKVVRTNGRCLNMESYSIARPQAFTAQRTFDVLALDRVYSANEQSRRGI